MVFIDFIPVTDIPQKIVLEFGNDGEHKNCELAKVLAQGNTQKEATRPKEHY